MSVIAIDIGRSAVKIAVDNKKLLIKTAVCPAVDAKQLAVGSTAEAAAHDTVEIDGSLYFLGETAERQMPERKSFGLRKDWIQSPEHKALLKGAYLMARREAGITEAAVVLGLPSELYAEQRDRLVEIAALTLGIDMRRVRVVPQPYGAFMALMLDEDSAIAEGRDPDNETWGVIDVGYYTTDFALIDRGHWATFAAVSERGTNSAASELVKLASHLNLKLPEADEILVSNRIKHDGKVVDLSKEVRAATEQLAATIVNETIRVFGDRLSRLDGILLAGGGSALVAKHLKAKWAHVECPPETRFAVAEGMRRVGAHTD